MQVSKKNLALAQLGPFASLRFLDLHDHIGGGENLGSAVADNSSRLAVDLIGRSDPGARVCLDDDAVTRSHILANRAWCQADPILVNFDLFRHTDAHRCTLLFRKRPSN